MGNMSGSYGEHYTLWQSITENFQNIAENYTNVTVRMYLTFDGSSYYAYINNPTYGNMGELGEYNISSLNYNSGEYKDILLAEWTGNVYHESDGSKYFSVTGYWDTNTTRMGSGTCSNGIWLTKIPRYTTVWNSERGKTVDSISVNWSTVDARDYTQYCLNNGEWKDAYDTVASDNKSGYYTISGLSPNTTYLVKTRCKRTDSQLWSEAEELSITTYDIARINSLNDFNHGDDISISITNPGNISNLNLEMKIDETQILTRSVNTGSNTIKMNDTELDDLYKQYGSSNEIVATIILTGSGYTNEKTCKVKLTGNQKTAKIKQEEWKRGKIWIKIENTWKRGIIWINKNGVWRRCI